MNMKWKISVLFGALLAVAFVNAEDKAPQALEQIILFKVQARPEKWQFSGAELKPGEMATITAEGKWFVVGRSGAGGSGRMPAPDQNYVFPTGYKGCLLVRIADRPETVRAFRKDDELVPVNVPGRIEFLANDEDPGSHGGKGYKDNHDFLTVTIRIIKYGK
jgi:hypothetical protein